MAEVPEGLRYTEEHEYVHETDSEGVFRVGITDYAQSELGDVVFVELPREGDEFERMDVFGTIEAVKAVSELYSPISGEIVAVNETLEDDPAVVNSDPYGDGWMVRIRASDASELDELMSSGAYEEHIGD